MTPSLATLHARSFVQRSRERGQELYRRGRVSLQDLTETSAEATVGMAGECEVTIDDFADPEAMWGGCDCPTFDRDYECEHVWATLLAIDEVLQGIAATEQSLAAGNDGAGARESRAVEPARRPSPPHRPQLAQVRKPEPLHWRERLSGVATAPSAALPASPVLEYYLTAPSTGSSLQVLMVQIGKRNVQKGGHLGALSNARLRSEELERLPVADRTLLSCYESDLRSRGYGTYRHSRPSTLSLLQPWVLTPDSLRLALPWLAKTGRTFRGPPPAAGAVAVPVQIDVDEPFRFEVVTDQGTLAGSTQPVQIRGLLVRGDQALPIDAVPGSGEEGYLLLADRLIRIELGAASQLARELARRGPIEVPAAETGELLATLARLPGARSFLQRSLPALPLGVPSGAVALRLPKLLEAPVPATLQYDYEGVAVFHGDDQPLVPGTAVAMRRDIEAEGVLWQQALAAGMQAHAGALQCERAQLGAVVAALVTAGLRVFAEGKPLRAFVTGKGSVRTGRDWLEVAGDVEFTGRATTLPELLRRKVTPDGFVELGDGSFGLLPGNWLRRIETLRLLGGEAGDTGVRLANSQALLLDAMLEAHGGDLAVDRKFAGLRQRFAEFRRVEPQQEPAGFQGELRPYQRQGLGWLSFLREFGLGGCLADDMGLGKTVQLLAHLLAVRGAPARGRRPSLLIAPRSVLSNWIAEAQRFAPTLRVVDFSGSDRWAAHGAELGAHDLVLSTYALVRTDAVKFAEREQQFHYVILDEAQMAKNADSQTSKAVRLLRAEHRLALTGTPVENHLGELWSLFEFLNPGMLGRLAAFRGLFGTGIDGEALRGHRELVQRALRPVLLRRTKAQVLTDLPEKVEQTLWCELEPAQRKRYDELRLHFRAKLLAGGAELGTDQRFVVLEALLRLRQAACHEGLLDPKRQQAPSAKFEALLPRLEELAAEGHKVLVFSQFTSFLDLVEPALAERGIGFARLDGQTRDRAAVVARFQQEQDCAVFLISLKAGGFGLNLTAADYVFVLDPWWNPAAEMQAIDRAHRIGQRRTVHAYRLVCRGTVEERVLELQAEKKALCEAILGNERSLLQDLTRADLDALLG